MVSAIRLQTISCELTHSAETSAFYKDISELVFTKMKQDSIDLEQRRQEIMSRHAECGNYLDSTGVDQEVVAYYIAENLLTNEQSITEFCREKPSLGRQILNWLDRFLARVGNVYVPVIIRIRTMDVNLRSQIYSMAIKIEAETSRGDGQQENLLDKHPNTYGGTSTSNKRLTQPKDNVNKQFSFSDSVPKRNVVSDLKDILRRGGDVSELRQYVAQMERNTHSAEQSGGYADQTTQEAEQIVQAAHDQGVSVDEYLRWNWEQYESDGQWNDIALQALEMEKADSGRQYSPLRMRSLANGKRKNSTGNPVLFL